MGLRILIPCKPLDSGKTRLAAVLPEQERAALCASLLAQTIALAAGIARTIVVTSDPAAAAICRRHHAQVLAEPPGEDLNAALTAAYRDVSPHDAVLVLPIDLPLLTSATILQVCAEEDLMTIVPDRHQRGTNLMLLPRHFDRNFRFRYGIDSFDRHRAEAQRLGVSCRVCLFPDAAFDLDTPDDLAELNHRRSHAEMAR
jgi:2-phospho-L-lactate/phosphoenolpyruvate guanylyltransferase